MRNSLFYILIICAYTNSFAENERKELLEKDTFELTREYFAEEARKDVESLLSNVKNRNESEEDEDDTRTLNIYRPRNIDKQKDIQMDKLDQILKKRNTNVAKESLRSNDQFDDDNSKHISRYDLMKNVPLYIRDVVKSRFDVLKSDSNNRFVQLINKLASSYNVNYPIKNINLRSRVNYVNIKPEVYPILLMSEDKYGAKKNASKEVVQSDDLYSNGEDEFTKVVNKLETKYGDKTGKNGTVMRSSYESMSKSLNQLNELLNRLNINYGKKIYAKSADYLRTGDRLEEEFENEMDLRDKDKRKTNITMLRTDLTDKMNSDINEQLDEFMTKFDTGRNLRTSTVTYDKSAITTSSPKAKQRGHGSRMKRSSTTQAGYTQNLDTCKTYNENLIKLWSNLSKYINVTEQPNERALHNIAMIIQAYLEHQNTKQPRETNKVKHEVADSRDKISEVIHKIRKILDEAEGNAEKITYIITKYLKPFYLDIESADCQQVNEEFLSSSVELLYKNYFENAECHGDGDNELRKKELSLRKQTDKTGKASSSVGHTTLSLENSDYKPEIKTIIIENKSHSDYDRRKTQRSTTKYRRVFNQNRKQRSGPVIQRSGNQIGSEKLKIRSKASPKSSNRKLKKSSLKSGLAKDRCEKYATRKLLVSLRPVIERFMELLECQLDNTLRSVNSNEDSRQHRTNLPRVKLTKKNTGRNKHDTSVENDQGGFVRDDETGSAWVRKYSHNYQNSNDYFTYNDYLQSPPLHNDYDGIHKTHHLTNSNYFPNILNPLFSHNYKKSAGDKSNNKNSATFDKEQTNENIRNIFYEESHPRELNYDSLIEAKSKIHVKNVESIKEFLKRARDASLQTPEIAVPFALDTKKGYVELTHLVKYPKILVYRPQFLVKNIVPYDDFLKTISHFNMINDEVRLMKIVRHLPDSSVKVLFETEDFEAPLEVKNLKRRSGSPNPEVNYQLQNVIDTANENTKFDFTDGSIEDFVPLYRNEVRSNVVDAFVKSDISDSYEDISTSNLEFDTDSDIIWRQIEEVSPNLDFNSGSDTLRHIEELSPKIDFNFDSATIRNIEELSPKLDYNSDVNTLRQKDELSPSLDSDLNSNTNTTSNSKPNSTSDSSSSLEFSSDELNSKVELELGNSSLASGLLSTIPGLSSNENRISGVGSAVDSQINSGIGTELDTALSLSSDSNSNSSSKPNSTSDLSSSLEFSLLPSLASGLLSTIPGLSSGKNRSSVVGSAVDSQIDSDIGTELDTALSLSSDSNSNSSSKPNSTSDSSSSLEFSSLPSLASGLLSIIPGLGSGKNQSSVVGSAIDSQIDSGIGTELDTALHSNSNSSSKPNSTSDSSSSLEFSLLPSLASELLSTIPNFGSGKNQSSVVGSAVDSQIDSGIGTELDTALSLNSDIKLNHPSNISSYISKLLPSHFNSPYISNSQPSLNSQTHISHSDSPSSAHSLYNLDFDSHSQLNSHLSSLLNSNSSSHSLLNSIASINLEVKSLFSPSNQYAVVQWWKKWKNIITDEIKKVIAKISHLADNIDHIAKL